VPSPLLSAPWRRAPWLPWRQPAVILAVVGAAAIMGCAAASAPLFLSSAGSASLQLQRAAQCPDAAYPVLQQIGFAVGGGRPGDVSDSAPAALIRNGLAPPERLVTINGTSSLETVSGGRVVAQVWYRDGALDEVTVLQRGTGSGLWLPETTAQYLGVKVGDPVEAGIDSYDGTPVVFPVAGIYRDVFREQTVRPYWCSYTALFLNPASVGAPPPLVLATSPEVVERVGDAGSMYGMNRQWISPIDTDRLTLSAAQGIVQARERAFVASRIANDTGGQGHTGQLPTMTDRAELLVQGLRGPVLPIAAGGAVLALLLVAAAGSYWADRRSTEVALLSSRGVGPVALGIKALLELAGPAAVGSALGLWAAHALVTRAGPSPYLDPVAPTQAALAAAASLLIALALLAAVAGARTRVTAERPIGTRRRWYAVFPWELLLVAAAAVGYLRVRRGEPIVLVRNVAQVDVLLVVVPLLFLAGLSILAARGLSGLLRPLRTRSARWPTAAFTAVTRAAAARPISALVLVALALPLSILAYSAGMTTTNEATLAAKAGVVVGSERAVLSVDEIPSSPALDRVGTVVVRYDRALADGQDVTVLAIDPRTFADWAFWDSRFADVPLADLLAALASPGTGPVRALALGLPAGTTALDLGATAVDAEVVATVGTFPGRRLPDPVVVVDGAALGTVDRSAGRQSEVWTTRSVDEVRAALPAEVRTSLVLERDTVFDVANFRSVSWSFGYLQALAGLIGIIGAGGLLLYLETRQRTRIASYALARRMGLTGGTHFRSLLLELGGLLGAAALVGAAAGWTVVLAVYRLIDIDPNRPPGPLLTAPTGALVTGAVTAAVTVFLAAGYAHYSAVRANPAQVVRLAT